MPIYRNHNAISALVGVIGFLGLWGWTLLGGIGDSNAPDMFLDLPGVLIVVAAPLAILTAVYGWAGVVDAILWVFRKPTPGKTAEDAIVFFQLWAAAALATGFLATIVGLVIMLCNMDDPDAIGPGMALALLSQLYGVFIAVICIAVAAHTARRHNGATSAMSVTRGAAGVAGITVIAGTLTAMLVFAILMLSLAPSL